MFVKKTLKFIKYFSFLLLTLLSIYGVNKFLSKAQECIPANPCIIDSECCGGMCEGMICTGISPATLPDTCMTKGGFCCNSENCNGTNYGQLDCAVSDVCCSTSCSATPLPSTCMAKGGFCCNSENCNGTNYGQLDCAVSDVCCSTSCSATPLPSTCMAKGGSCCFSKNCNGANYGQLDCNFADVCCSVSCPDLPDTCMTFGGVCCDDSESCIGVNYGQLDCTVSDVCCTSCQTPPTCMIKGGVCCGSKDCPSKSIIGDFEKNYYCGDDKVCCDVNATCHKLPVDQCSEGFCFNNGDKCHVGKENGIQVCTCDPTSLTTTCMGIGFCCNSKTQGCLKDSYGQLDCAVDEFCCSTICSSQPTPLPTTMW